MKLSIVIFVLATIIFGCQCAPNPGWREDFDQHMQEMHNKLETQRQERNEYMKRLQERLERERQQREENMKRLQERLERERQQREENMKRLQERLKVERQQREENMKQIQPLSKGDGVPTIVSVNNSNINGVHIYQRVEEKTINNVIERTVTDYISATGKTEIKKYKCDISTNSPCVLENTEVKNGPPENVYYYP